MAANQKPPFSAPVEEIEDEEDEQEEFEDDAMDDDSDGVAFAQTENRNSKLRIGKGVVVAAGSASGSRTSELTMSFEGEVYVFPAVTPEKVQAVLLLLGGRDIPTGVPATDVSLDRSIRGGSPKQANLSRRIASLVRFREKRKERCFDKKIRYTVRKEVAQRMHRKNGQFASVKVNSSTVIWDPTQGGNQGDITPQTEAELRRCHHCGISESSTPAMRRGPAGPRTLCNACGLMWANKGTLRDLSKGGRNHSCSQTEMGTLFDVKPAVVHKENFSSNRDEIRPAEAFTGMTEGNGISAIGVDEQEDLDSITEEILITLPTRSLPTSSNIDEQEHQLELHDIHPDSDIDIPNSLD